MKAVSFSATTARRWSVVGWNGTRWARLIEETSSGPLSEVDITAAAFICTASFAASCSLGGLRFFGYASPPISAEDTVAGSGNLSLSLPVLPWGFRVRGQGQNLTVLGSADGSTWEALATVSSGSPLVLPYAFPPQAQGTLFSHFSLTCGNCSDFSVITFPSLPSLNATLAFDGNKETFWSGVGYSGGVYFGSKVSGNYSGDWIGLDLPAAAEVGAYALSAGPSPPARWALLGSRNGGQWSLLSSSGGGLALEPRGRAVFSANPCDCSRFRLVCLSAPGPTCDVAELVLLPKVQSESPLTVRLHGKVTAKAAEAMRAFIQGVRGGRVVVVPSEDPATVGFLGVDLEGETLDARALAEVAGVPRVREVGKDSDELPRDPGQVQSPVVVTGTAAGAGALFSVLALLFA